MSGPELNRADSETVEHLIPRRALVAHGLRAQEKVGVLRLAHRACNAGYANWRSRRRPKCLTRLDTRLAAVVHATYQQHFMDGHNPFPVSLDAVAQKDMDDLVIRFPHVFAARAFSREKITLTFVDDCIVISPKQQRPMLPIMGRT
jgi:hypothetical protein